MELESSIQHHTSMHKHSKTIPKVFEEMFSLEERIATISWKLDGKNVFEEMFSLEERIATISWKLDGKTYEDDCQQYQRKYRKQIPTGANIRLETNW
ncbi:hypothetical protein TNCV_2867911 [Trichonephila clavipes]|nr:hypothetical protein TNCV_2867911 [Trichonephila clavipes]